MKNIVFYSWQSDLPNNVNRSFIERSLEKAIKKLKADSEILIEPSLDKDTAGVSGAPSIADSIFHKISKSEVFVADVSCINSGTSGKKIPNPNVLVELGYAIAKLGWSRIILVCNTVYGGINELPFDIRSHRITEYCLSENESEENKIGISSKLVSKLSNQIKSCLHFSYLSTGKNSDCSRYWIGLWKGKEHQSNLITLDISETSSFGFLFSLKVSTGAHTGEIEGYADFLSPSHAMARINKCNSICEISFRKDPNESGSSIEIAELRGCQNFHGMRASFNGIVYREQSRFEFESNAHEIVVQRLKRLLGKDYQTFEYCMASVGKLENLDNFVCDCFWGEVVGARQDASAAIMVGEEAQIWVAFIKDGVIQYYTTEPEHSKTLPETLNVWRKDFSLEICYSNSLNGNTESFIPKNVVRSVGFSLMQLKLAMTILNELMPGETNDPMFSRLVAKSNSFLMENLEEELQDGDNERGED